MAHYRRHHHIIIQEVADLESDRLRRDMFDGNEDCTRVKLSSISGTIDPWTEEITYYESVTYESVSGIVGTIAEDDMLLGLGGRIREGDTMVTYHYDTISGIYLNNELNDIELCVPGISGLYHVEGHKVGTVGARPMFVKVALKLDSND